MKTRILLAAIAAVALGVVAATASAGVDRAQANKLTVWLQVDAQSGWPDLVASTNAKFESDHPGVNVQVQYQTWPTHLQKFDATLAGGNTPDVIEMGNTEMTKYMAAGAFADISSFEDEVRRLIERASHNGPGASTDAALSGPPAHAGRTSAATG